MKLALCGNPNSGKTTLLNRLAGARLRTGNFPGVTVERAEAPLLADPTVTLIDLPGVYALDAPQGEEALARAALFSEKPDAILNVLDATSLSRGLCLTLELIETGVPVLVALTMLDELPQKGAEIDFSALSRELGAPVFPANNCETTLLAALKRLALRRETPHGSETGRCSGSASGVAQTAAPATQKGFTDGSRNALVNSHSACKRESLAKHGENQHGNPSCNSWANGAGEQSPTASHNAALPFTPRSAQSIRADKHNGLGKRSLNTPGTSSHPRSSPASISARFSRADEIVARTLRGTGETTAQARSRRADRILMHPLFAAPIFLAVMAAMLYLTFGPVGGTLGSLLGGGVERAFAALDRLLTRASAPEWIHGLLCEGVLNGLGAVLGFLPTVLTLFFLLSLIEDSGYMARMACCADRLFRRLGLNGRAFVPALLGFGCTVPAILATRTLPDARDRRRMTLLLPFCSCSAKLPVYSLFAAAFFPGRETLVIGALYALGALLMLPAAFCMNRLAPGDASAFVLELPSYRMPSARAAFSLMRTRSRVFVRCALTTLLPASVAVWLLNAVRLGGRSLLEAIAGAIAPAFLPAGFGSWQAVAALLTGLSAKEAVLSTFGVLLHAPGTFALRAALRQLFTPLSAASFLTFTLLYTPCAAALGAARRELGSVRTALCAAILQCGAAYLAACAVFNLGRLFGLQ